MNSDHLYEYQVSIPSTKERAMENLVATIIEEQKPCLFVSPHLDDAILSAGALISHLAGKTPVTIATVFTEASASPYTRTGRFNLRACGYSEARALLADRRSEDRAVCDGLGVDAVHLGFVDSSFRKKDPRGPILNLLGNLLGEVIHLYPTRRHIFSGRIARGDGGLLQILTEQLSLLATQLDAAPVVFCPAAVGNHVDHVITRKACHQQFASICYWLDVPYFIEHGKNVAFPSRDRLIEFTWQGNLEKKRALISGYRSQLPLIFPGGVPLFPAEYFFTEPGFPGVSG